MVQPFWAELLLVALLSCAVQLPANSGEYRNFSGAFAAFDSGFLSSETKIDTLYADRC